MSKPLLISLSVCLALSSCQQQESRKSIPDTEKRYHAEYSTEKTRKETYDATEIQLVKVYNNARNVTQLKQPENGKIIVQALTGSVLLRKPDSFSELSGNIPYTLEITCSDKSLVMDFEVTGGATISGASQYGYYSFEEYPANMRPVFIDFQGVAAGIARACSGVLSKESPLPAAPPAPKTPAPSVRGK